MSESIAVFFCLKIDSYNLYTKTFNDLFVTLYAKSPGAINTNIILNMF